MRIGEAGTVGTAGPTCLFVTSDKTHPTGKSCLKSRKMYLEKKSIPKTELLQLGLWIT
jgi:hypothetical protein